MKSPQLIIFDLDGVLANTEHFYMEGISEALIQQGFTNYTPEYCEKNTAGMAAPVIFEKIAKETGKQVDFDAFNQVIEKHQKNFEANITPIVGAEDFIKSLKIPFCVASSSNLIQIKRTLKAIKLDKYFSENSMFSCFTINKFKPNPAIYLEALKAMKYQASDAIAIEDSVPGVKAASGADIPTIGFVGADYLKNRQKEQGNLLITNGAFIVKNNYEQIKKLLFSA